MKYSRFIIYFIFLGTFMSAASLTAISAGEIEITNVHAVMLAPDRYALKGSITNQSDVAREVTLRAQITFYDRSSPKGDVPAFILRKDFIEVLEKGEVRELNVSMFNEGTIHKGALRLEPILRIRRQREWVY